MEGVIGITCTVCLHIAYVHYLLAPTGSDVDRADGQSLTPLAYYSLGTRHNAHVLALEYRTVLLILISLAVGQLAHLSGRRWIQHHVYFDLVHVDEHGHPLPCGQREALTCSTYRVQNSHLIGDYLVELPVLFAGIR